MLRGIVIILMVLGHTEPPDTVRDFLSCFRMPLFVIVSGFFFKLKDPFGVFIVKKFNRLIVPFLFYSFASWIVATGIVMEWYPEWLFKQLIRPALILAGLEFNAVIYFNTPLWFLTFLFSVSLINFIVYKVTRTRMQTFLLAVGISAIGMLTGYMSISELAGSLNFNYSKLLLPYYFNAGMGACVLFWFGTLYFPVVRKRLKALKSWWAVGLMLLCAGVYTCLYQFNCPSNIEGNPIDIRTCAYGNNILLFYLLVALMFTAVVILCNLIGCIRPINYIGRNTIVVLIFNYPIRYTFYTLFPSLEAHWWLATILHVMISLPLIWLINRYLPWTIGEKPVLKQDWLFAKFPFLAPKEQMMQGKT